MSGVALFLEAVFRWQHGEWPRVEERSIGAGKARYVKVGKGGVDGETESGWGGRYTVDGEDENGNVSVAVVNGKHDGGKRKGQKGRAKAVCVNGGNGVNEQDEMDML